MQQPIYNASDEMLLMTRLWQPRITTPLMKCS